MARSNKYSTKQIQLLYDYLKNTKGTYLTVKDIVNHFESINIKISNTTVYRNLEKMIIEGTVVKHKTTNSSSAFFEYICDGSNHSPDNNSHLICENCGDVKHFDIKKLTTLNKHILNETGFTISPIPTTLYGKCKDCS